ncbi:hypothetical protein [Sphaerothrix gracilis]|uniref:hypothetical protein n=1 Tax=Sphaerothrix gracilis TaxID=3151835 RepID=UPI0031FC72F7
MSIPQKAALILGVSGTLIAVSMPVAQAQLQVTGGGATINDAQVFQPDTGDRVDAANPTTVIGTDNRSVIYEGEFLPSSILIETNQGPIPSTAIFRPTTFPVFDTSVTNPGSPLNVSNIADGTRSGEFQGTLSFRSLNATGGASFFNIPTTLNFSVTAATGGTELGAVTEYRAENFILQETGVATSGSSFGVVQRRTPVDLVQYANGDLSSTSPENQTVFNRSVAAAAYDVAREGIGFGYDSLELGFDSGVILTPPGFDIDGNTLITDGVFEGEIETTRSTVTFISYFNENDIIEIIGNLDEVEYGNEVEPPDGYDDDVADNSDDSDDSDSDSDDSDSDDSDSDSDSESDTEEETSEESDSDSGEETDNNNESGSEDSEETTDDSEETSEESGSGDDDTDDSEESDDTEETDEETTDSGDRREERRRRARLRRSVQIGAVQVRPIFPRFVFIGVFVFQNVPSGRWFDPPATDGFEYEMIPRDVPVGLASRIFPGMTGVGQADDSLFTAISGFPQNVDADDRFTVSVEGQVLGEFGPGDTVNFSDYAELLGDRLVDGTGVRKFVVADINPSVDAANPVAFPLKVDFSTATASFEMRAMEATATAPVSQVSLETGDAE